MLVVVSQFKKEIEVLTERCAELDQTVGELRQALTSSQGNLASAEGHVALLTGSHTHMRKNKQERENQHKTNI